MSCEYITARFGTCGDSLAIMRDWARPENCGPQSRVGGGTHIYDGGGVNASSYKAVVLLAPQFHKGAIH